MNRPVLQIERVPKLTMLVAGEKCLYKIIHFRRGTKTRFKEGYYIVPTAFATVTIRQHLSNRRFRSQKVAVDFCKSALSKFQKMIADTVILEH